MAWLDESGKLRFRPFDLPDRKRDRARPAFGPLSGYATVAALPTDPDALLRRAYDQAVNITNGPDSTDDGEVSSSSTASSASTCCRRTSRRPSSVP
jgi:hypothetical protein